MPATDPHAAAREQVATELRRVVRRWQQLPLDHALSVAPTVRDLLQSLADRAASARGLPLVPVPDLGPAVLMDQLTVLARDDAEAGLDPAALAADLTALRRAL